MAKRSDATKWLNPSYRRVGGQLWPPRRDSRLQVPEVAPPLPVRVSTDPFTAEERRYLCTRLPRLELDRRGVDAPVARLRGIDRSQRVALIVHGLREKGLLKLKHEDGRPILVLTSLGKAALKQVFLRQLSNHALLYPALHRQLGVDIINEK